MLPKFSRIFFLLFISVSSCLAVEREWRWESLKSVIETSIRALCAVDEKTCWFGSGNGATGRTTDGGKTWKLFVVKGAEKVEFSESTQDQQVLKYSYRCPHFRILTG